MEDTEDAACTTEVPKSKGTEQILPGLPSKSLCQQEMRGDTISSSNLFPTVSSPSLAVGARQQQGHTQAGFHHL